jgi:hypothetical protein
MLSSRHLHQRSFCCLVLQVRSVDVKEALRLQKENSFVILDVRPEAEFKQVSCSFLFRLLDLRQLLPLTLPLIFLCAIHQSETLTGANFVCVHDSADFVCVHDHVMNQTWNICCNI